MPSADQISLNALRVFAVVAELGSLKGAAGRLGVTAGAVSRQVQNLELAMGLALFTRSHNALSLTGEGAALLAEVVPALAALQRALDHAMGDGQTITARVSTSLASRWLIPRLRAFKSRWPEITIRIETEDSVGPLIGAYGDVSLGYAPLSAALKGVEILIEDRCRPYLAPGLLADLADPGDLARIPALQGARDNWDWALWLGETGREDVDLSFAGHFDLDDVALRAAIAGMGMVLAPEFLIRDDLAAGRLCPLPGSAEVLLGHYTLHVALPGTPAVRRFVRWLKAEV